MTFWKKDKNNNQKNIKLITTYKLNHFEINFLNLIFSNNIEFEKNKNNAKLKIPISIFHKDLIHTLIKGKKIDNKIGSKIPIIRNQ